MSRKPNNILTLGPDFVEYPSEHWGTRDWEQVEARNQPLNETLPPAPPQRTLPAGFSLFPNRQRPPTTVGEKAVQEIRSKLGR
jgi:hypothetical protein